MSRVRRINVVEPFHPLIVGGVLCWPTDRQGVISEDGTLYCTPAAEAEARAKYGVNA